MWWGHGCRKDLVPLREQLKWIHPQWQNHHSMILWIFCVFLQKESEPHVISQCFTGKKHISIAQSWEAAFSSVATSTKSKLSRTPNETGRTGPKYLWLWGCLGSKKRTIQRSSWQIGQITNLLNIPLLEMVLICWMLEQPCHSQMFPRNAHWSCWWFKIVGERECHGICNFRWPWLFTEGSQSDRNKSYIDLCLLHWNLRWDLGNTLWLFQLAPRSGKISLYNWCGMDSLGHSWSIHGYISATCNKYEVRRCSHSSFQ
jgi:hypothetical protein